MTTATIPAVPGTTAPGLASAALWFATRGWHVFPLAPGSKRPAVEAWETAAATGTR